VLDQAVATGDDYHPDKCGFMSLSQTGPTEEKGEGGQGCGIPEGNPDSNSHRGTVHRSDLNWDPKSDKDS
jgi:hypothetical protein